MLNPTTGVLMKTPRSPIRSLLVALIGTVMMIGESQAGVSCHKINAKGTGQDLGGGVTNANINGGGLLNGTTVGNFAIIGFDPPVASIVGTVVFTTKRATLTVTVAGTFDTNTGEFIASGPVTGATGKLAGATGTLLLDGIQDLANGTFVEDVTGVVCVDLSP
jgi:hypothetical protein